MPARERLHAAPRDQGRRGVEVYGGGRDAIASSSPTAHRAGRRGRLARRFTLRSGLRSRKPPEGARAVRGQPSITAGTTVGLVGESGSGKTTLARIIMRAWKPDEGTRLVRRRHGAARRVRARRRRAQGLPARRPVRLPGSVLEPQSAHDGLRHPGGAAAHPRYRHRGRTIRARQGSCWTSSASTSASCGATRIRSPAASASASALRARSPLSPSVILCDEPTSALDVSVQAQILNLLKDLQKALGHLLSFRVAQPRRRRLHGDRDRRDVPRHHRRAGAARHLFRDPQHPYTRALLAAIPEPDLDHPLDFAKVSDAGFSDPGALAAALHDRCRGEPRPAMIEVAPRHCVCMAARRASRTGSEGLA